MAALPEPWKSLRAELEKMREQIRALYNRSPFFGTGMHANGNGGIDSDNFVAGTSGYSFKSDGNAEFNDLTLRGGIIGNDALTDPILTQTYRASALGFSLNTSWVEKAGVDITVPEGFTQASVVLLGRLYAVNQNTTGGADGTGTDAIYVRIGIDGNFTVATPTGVSGSNGFATTVGMDSFPLSGLTPGSTIRLSAQATTGYQTIASYVDNYINGVASVTWLR